MTTQLAPTPYAEYLTVDEAAVFAGAPVSAIRRWLRQGVLRTIQTSGGRVRIDPESLVDAYLAGSRCGTSAVDQPDDATLDEATERLRDEFAKAALPGLLTSCAALVTAQMVIDVPTEAIAEQCYVLADALLAARERSRK